MAKLDAGPNAIQLQFVANPSLDPADIIVLIQSDRSFKLAGRDRLAWKKETANLKERVVAVRGLFRKLRREEKH